MTSADEKMAVAALGLESTQAEEDLSGVPKHLQPAAREHGLGLFQLTYMSGVGQHAFELLIQAGRMNRDQGLLNAVATAAEMFNRVGEALMKEKGWTTADTAACDVSIRRCMDTKIIVPRRGGIILDS